MDRQVILLATMIENASVLGARTESKYAWHLSHFVKHATASKCMGHLVCVCSFDFFIKHFFTRMLPQMLAHPMR